MSDPLNPTLFHQLERVFGHVKVANAGMSMVGGYRWDPSEKRDKLALDVPGEQYRVSCDRCTDTRFRLFFHHRWGVRDDRGHQNLHLCYCQNENCYADSDRRLTLYEKLTSGRAQLAQAKILSGVVADPNQPCELPGPVIPLHQLAAVHPANKYLAGRFYVPERLGKFYGVGYCAESFYYLARHRIVAPIYQNNVLRGWQARYIGDLDWSDKSNPPKWWSCPGMRKSQLLYNYDNAVHYRTGIIVEGPADVWSVGPMAMATFGATMSMFQRRQFVSAFRDYGGVLLYDEDVSSGSPETVARYRKMFVELRKEFGGRLALVVPPKGKDPGDMDRGFLRDYVAAEAAKQDVAVSWARR